MWLSRVRAPRWSDRAIDVKSLMAYPKIATLVAEESFSDRCRLEADSADAADAMAPNGSSRDPEPRQLAMAPFFSFFVRIRHLSSLLTQV